MSEKAILQIRNILTILLVIVSLTVCKLMDSVSINLVLALLIFLLVTPLIYYFEKKKLPTFFATFAALLLILIVFIAAIWFIVYLAELLVANLPSYATRMNQMDETIISFLARWFDIPQGTSMSGLLDIDWVSTLMPLLKSVSGIAFSVLENSFVTILLVFFLLLERHTIIPKLLTAVKVENQAIAVSILEKCNKQVSKYIVIKLIISLATGLTFFMIAKIVKLDFAAIWGILTVIMNFVPTFGSIVITSLLILMTMIQHLPSWGPVIFVAVSGIATQVLFGNIIEPKIQGDHLNLSPFVILAALSIFGYVWGLAGMFLAVPLLSIIEIIMSNIETTKGVAIMLSSGSSLIRSMQKEDVGMQPGLFSKDYDSNKTDKQ